MNASSACVLGGSSNRVAFSAPARHGARDLISGAADSRGDPIMFMTVPDVAGSFAGPPFPFQARRGICRPMKAPQVEFTALGITYALSDTGSFASKALTSFRESETPGKALPDFSKARPPLGATGQHQDERAQALVFRHFIVIGEGK